MATITVLIGDPPYGTQRVYTALRFAITALREGHQVNMFAFEDALFTAKANQSPHEFPGVREQLMPNCELLLRAAIGLGARVKLCGVCAAERGIDPAELIDGVEIAAMRDMVGWVVESDRTVSF